MKGRDIHWIVVFVGLSYSASWAVWWIGMLATPELTRVSDERFFWFLIAGSFAPSVSALLVTGYTGGITSIGCLLSRLVRIKVNWRVYVMTFFVLPTLGIAIFLGLGISNKIDLSKIAITAVALMPVNALLGGVVFGVGPLGEEMGWRGFLQDHLQGQGRSVVIAIVVGAIWSVWHAPIAVSFDDFRSGLSLWEFAILYPVFTILSARGKPARPAAANVMTDGPAGPYAGFERRSMCLRQFFLGEMRTIPYFESATAHCAKKSTSIPKAGRGIFASQSAFQFRTSMLTFSQRFRTP